MQSWARTAILCAFGWPLAASGQHATEQTAELDRATEVLERLEEAARSARANAAVAEGAARDAELRLVEARQLMEVIRNENQLVSAEFTYAASATDSSETASDECFPGSGSIASRTYFENVEECEGLIRPSVSAFAARSVTGFGSVVETGTSGSAATIRLQLTTPYRNILSGRFGLDSDVLQQRISREIWSLGVRAELSKSEPKIGTIATFGQLDKLSSSVALLARYGREYHVAERFFANPSGDTTRVEDRASAAERQLVADCTKARGANPDISCAGIGLLRWIFSEKDGGFTNPGAVKVYNDVFWGPPKSDINPRWGWMLTSEISRPQFTYYPFPLAAVADPFNPGKLRTVIDPSSFPSNFAANLIEESKLNFSVGARVYFHASPLRTQTAVRRYTDRLAPYVEQSLGTTFVLTGAYVREDAIEKPFRDISICPGALASQTFYTEQACTSVNIAAPRRREGLVVGAEVRQGIEPFWVFPPTLVAARLTHDFDTEEYGLSVPLYFAKDSSGIFSGGLRFAHRWNGRNADGSEKRAESVFGVVVGLSTSLSGFSDLE